MVRIFGSGSGCLIDLELFRSAQVGGEHAPLGLRVDGRHRDGRLECVGRAAVGIACTVDRLTRCVGAIDARRRH